MCSARDFRFAGYGDWHGLHALAELQTLAKFAHGGGRPDMFAHETARESRMPQASLTLKLKLSPGIRLRYFFHSAAAKNVMIYGEAEWSFSTKLLPGIAKYTRKQGTHLPSKMRFDLGAI